MTINEALDYVEDIIKTVTFTEEQKIDEQFFNNVKDWLEELKFLRQWKSDVVAEFCKYDCNSVEEAVHSGYNKAIYNIFEFLKTKRDKKTMKVNLDDLEIRKYKEQILKRRSRKIDNLYEKDKESFYV